MPLFLRQSVFFLLYRQRCTFFSSSSSSPFLPQAEHLLKGKQRPGHPEKSTEEVEEEATVPQRQQVIVEGVGPPPPSMSYHVLQVAIRLLHLPKPELVDARLAKVSDPGNEDYWQQILSTYQLINQSILQSIETIIKFWWIANAERKKVWQHKPVLRPPVQHRQPVDVAVEDVVEVVGIGDDRLRAGGNSTRHRALPLAGHVV